MNSLLVTGGCGFIGSNLIEFILAENDWHITVLDNLSEGRLKYLKSIDGYSKEKIRFIKGDIRNEDDVEKAVAGCDYVIHLAAQTSVVESVKEPKRDADINIMGTLNLLDESVGADIDKFILASSAAPLGDQEMPIHEDKVPKPLAPYGASKLACEGYCSAYSGSHDLNTTALRFSNVYGPKCWHKGSVVAKFIKQILKGSTPVIYGDGDQTRDFIHTRDISQALYLACVEEIEGCFDLFQIGTGIETSVNEVYSILQSKLEKEGIEVPEPNLGEERKGEIYRNYTDIEKARKKLDYSPQVDIEEGIEETIDWFLNNWSEGR